MGVEWTNEDWACAGAMVAIVTNLHRVGGHVLVEEILNDLPTDERQEVLLTIDMFYNPTEYGLTFPVYRNEED